MSKVNCVFCNDLIETSCLGKHLKKYHFQNVSNVNEAIITAYEQLTRESIIDLYQKECLSGKEIAYKIHKVLHVTHDKSIVLRYLKQHNIKRRTTVEANTVYSAHHDVWNKNLTKNDHDSIKSYSEKRTGENNPIYNTTHEQRSFSNHRNRLKREGRFDELERLTQELSIKTKAWYQNPTNRQKYDEAYEAARPKQQTNVLNGMHKYYESFTSQGLIPPQFTYKTSKPEQLIKDALIQLGLEFKHQYFVSSMSYDFYVKQYNLLIEVNGAYWHGHESIFLDENFVHKQQHKTIKEIREYDVFKQNKPLEFEYRVLVLWDFEYDTIETAINLLKIRLGEL